METHQSVKKVEVQEALPPAGVIGAEPLNLVPQHFSRKPAKRCLRARAANMGVFRQPAEFPWKRIVLFDHGQSPEITEMDFPPNTGCGRYDSA